MQKTISTSILLLCFLAFHFIGRSQVAYEHIQNKAIYEFLDELASQHIIELNSAIKPYSRTFICEQLLIAEKKQKSLNRRQQKELASYQKEYAIENAANFKKSKHNIFSKSSSFSSSFNPISINNFDSNFRATLRPIFGRTYSYRDDKEYRYHNRVGASFIGYIGKNLSIYGSLRDNYQKNDIFAKPSYLTLYEGGSYKTNEGGRIGADYSEMRGGIVYSWKWGHIGIVKDHIEWGDNYHGSNILSGRTPSYASIKLNLKPSKWFEFNYMHGWLVSMVPDSSRSYITSNGDPRVIYQDKYIAANMFTIRPFRDFQFSFGNSIIYSDKSIQAAYLIPVMFYKSIDHTLTRGVENENSQMFCNISSRNIKNIHLYTSIFIDEFSFTRIGGPYNTNMISYKGGVKTSNFLLKNISLTCEYTQTMPITFKHRVPSTTFESNLYNLGHYLIDNSEELFLNLSFKPTSNITISTSYTLINKGNDYQYITSNFPILNKVIYLKDVIWKKQAIEFNIFYRIINNMALTLGVSKSIIEAKAADGYSADYYMNKYVSPFERGNHLILTTGLNIGI